MLGRQFESLGRVIMYLEIATRQIEGVDAPLLQPIVFGGAIGSIAADGTVTFSMITEVDREFVPDGLTITQLRTALTE